MQEYHVACRTHQDTSKPSEYTCEQACKLANRYQHKATMICHKDAQGHGQTRKHIGGIQKHTTKACGSRRETHETKGESEGMLDDQQNREATRENKKPRRSEKERQKEAASGREM